MRGFGRSRAAYEVRGERSASLHPLGRPASAALRQFMRVDEMLTDIADDLYDYEKDVRSNSFNILRGVVHAVGGVSLHVA